MLDVEGLIVIFGVVWDAHHRFFVDIPHGDQICINAGRQHRLIPAPYLIDRHVSHPLSEHSKGLLLINDTPTFFPEDPLYRTQEVRHVCRRLRLAHWYFSRATEDGFIRYNWSPDGV